MPHIIFQTHFLSWGQCDLWLCQFEMHAMLSRSARAWHCATHCAQWAHSAHVKQQRQEGSPCNYEQPPRFERPSSSPFGVGSDAVSPRSIWPFSCLAFWLFSRLAIWLLLPRLGSFGLCDNLYSILNRSRSCSYARVSPSIHLSIDIMYYIIYVFAAGAKSIQSNRNNVNAISLIDLPAEQKDVRR